MEIKAHPISRGVAEGEAVVYNGGFSFMGDLDQETGELTGPHHPLRGTKVAGKIFIFTVGKGSASNDSAAWNARKKGSVPAAVICMESEPILSGALIVTEIPAVDKPEADIFTIIKTGDRVRVDANRGMIELLGSG